MTVERLELAFKIALAGFGLIAVSGLLHTVSRAATDPPDIGAYLADAAAIMSGWGFFDWLVMIGFALLAIAGAIIFADVMLDAFGREADAE